MYMVTLGFSIRPVHHLTHSISCLLVFFTITATGIRGPCSPAAHVCIHDAVASPIRRSFSVCLCGLIVWRGGEQVKGMRILFFPSILSLVLCLCLVSTFHQLIHSLSPGWCALLGHRGSRQGRSRTPQNTSSAWRRRSVGVMWV